MKTIYSKLYNWKNLPDILEKWVDSNGTPKIKKLEKEAFVITDAQLCINQHSSGEVKTISFVFINTEGKRKFSLIHSDWYDPINDLLNQ